MTPRIGSVCTGYGGLDEAVRQVFGGELAWVSDIDAGACRIIRHRMPGVPNLGDLTTTRWEDVEPVDIYIGGYPCQPFSTAGHRKGTDDERHLWPFIAGALRVLRPRIAIFENVANHLRVGFGSVLVDLADLGFDVEWCVVRADEVGAPHQRRRLFVLAVAADAADLGHEWARTARGRGHGPADRGDAPAHSHSHERVGEPDEQRRAAASPRSGDRLELWNEYAPAVARWEAATGRYAPWATDDQGRLSPAFVEWLMGLPAGHVTDVPGLTRTQQIKALGNGVIPQQAAAAVQLLAQRAGLRVAAA
ncbi:DNA cytosine methyltransferase [Streptomyces antibioticus]|uniref:DNA cytosine methyltransferase n=1 Tax=Streptomyces antibioticus TaxID=1890 RepID=UPI0033BD74B7